jgi:hypothetical protein
MSTLLEAKEQVGLPKDWLSANQRGQREVAYSYGPVFVEDWEEILPGEVIGSMQILSFPWAPLQPLNSKPSTANSNE